MARAAIALGSNLEPERHLREAVRRLAECLRLTAASRVYRTPPIGYADQPDFLNAVVLAETGLPPGALMDALLAIESALGRERPFPNAPRTLDLDLLALDGTVSHHPHVILPHPRLHERGFVLVPLCDVWPDWRHPRLGRTAHDLLEAVDVTGIVADALELTLPERIEGSGTGPATANEQQ